MMVELSRRSFVTALIAAPVIVRATSLMPIKAFDPYYTRYLSVYDITIDRMLLRIDRALFPPTDLAPLKGIEVVPAHVAHRFVSKRSIDLLLQPTGRIQVFMYHELPGGHYHDAATGMARSLALAA